MHFDRDTLIFKALVALDEIADQAGAEPVEPSYAVRFTLAWLYAAGNGDRSVLDGFFQTMRDPMTWTDLESKRAYMRTTKLRSGVKGAMHTLGLTDFTPEFFQALGRARLPKEERQRIAEARKRQLEAAEAQAAREDADRRRRNGCGWL